MFFLTDKEGKTPLLNISFPKHSIKLQKNFTMSQSKLNFVQNESQTRMHERDYWIDFLQNFIIYC